MPYMLVCSNCRSLGVEGRELLASRLRLGGDTIEMLDDDEISIASDDGRDEEVNENGNVWPRSGLQA